MLLSDRLLEMAYATDDHRAALFVSGLVLMGLILVLVAIAEAINRGRIYA